MWSSCHDKWSQADKDKYNKEARAANKEVGEKNELKRKENVSNAFNFEKNKTNINNTASTSNNQSSNNSSQKM